jgi:mannose-6-phosphate isomerase-like protein (cupin superfamily)
MRLTAAKRHVSDGHLGLQTRTGVSPKADAAEVSGADNGWEHTEVPMQTRPFPSTPEARSPAGAEIRYLIEGETGGMIHSTVPPGQVNRATVHATVSEFWHVLSGDGQIWRRDRTGEETTFLRAGVSIDIPVGTAFQYRCDGADALKFICITMPPWPGDQEATVIDGPWMPTAPAGR